MADAPPVPPLDFSRLTLGEVATLEELSGLGLDQLGADGVPKGKLLAAMAYVAAKRGGARITWAAALELTIEEANALLGVTPDDDGAAAAGTPGEEADGDPNA